MKKTNKGFTIVELVVVIAVVAVLAAVLIPTFTSIIKKANDSAYLQERQNQRIEDLAEKIDNQNYLTWDDFEGKIAEAIAEATPTGDHLTAEEVKTAIQSAIDEYSAAQANTRLTEDQVKKIVEKSLEGQVTMEQITALVNKAAAANPGVNVATVQSIVNQAIAGMSANPGLSAAQVSAMITSALQGQTASTEKTVAEAVAAALAQYAANNPSLTAEQVETIVEEALAAQTPRVITVNTVADLIPYTESTLFTRNNTSFSVLYTVKEDIVFDLKNTIELHGMFGVAEGCECTILLNGNEFKVLDYSLNADEAVSSLQQIIAINIAEGATLTMTDTVGTGGFKMTSYFDGTPNWYGLFYNQGTLNLNGGTYSNYVADFGVSLPTTVVTNLGTLNIGAGTVVGYQGTGTVNDNR